MNNTEIFYKFLEEYNLTGEEVANLFTDYHGTQLLSDDFMENLVDEGYEVPGFGEDED